MHRLFAIVGIDGSGRNPLLILSDSGAQGPETFTPNTRRLGFTVIPEAAVTFVGVFGLVLFTQRRRSTQSLR